MIQRSEEFTHEVNTTPGMLHEGEIDKELQFLIEKFSAFPELTSMYNMICIHVCFLLVVLYDFYGIYMSL